MKKKLVILALTLALILVLSSCALLNKPKMSTYAAWASDMEKLDMIISHYSSIQVDAYEKDVLAIVPITKPIKRVCHAISMPRWAYIVEFSNESDAQLFYQSVTADLGFNGKISGAVIIYGEDSVIATLK